MRWFFTSDQYYIIFKFNIFCKTSKNIKHIENFWKLNYEISEDFMLYIVIFQVECLIFIFVFRNFFFCKNLIIKLIFFRLFILGLQNHKIIIILIFGHDPNTALENNFNLLKNKKKLIYLFNFILYKFLEYIEVYLTILEYFFEFCILNRGFVWFLNILFNYFKMLYYGLKIVQNANIKYLTLVWLWKNFYLKCRWVFR